MTVPARPSLKTLPLPFKLAGGLLLFGTSVPPERKAQAEELAQLAQHALRNDPIVTMELGAGIEIGGCFASASSVDALVINCQVNGGNSWAECTAFGAIGAAGLELIDLSISNMDAAMTGAPSLTLSPVWRNDRAGEGSSGTRSPIAEAMAAAQAQALNEVPTRVSQPKMCLAEQQSSRELARQIRVVGLSQPCMRGRAASLARVTMELEEEASAAETSTAEAAAASLEEKMSGWEASEAEVRASTLGGNLPLIGTPGLPGRMTRTDQPTELDGFDLGMNISGIILFPLAILLATFPFWIRAVDLSEVGAPPMS